MWLHSQSFASPRNLHRFMFNTEKGGVTGFVFKVTKEERKALVNLEKIIRNDFGKLDTKCCHYWE